MSYSQPASQPESIDLAYDMWAGQFEFLGPTAKSSLSPTTSTSPSSSSTCLSSSSTARSTTTKDSNMKTAPTTTTNNSHLNNIKFGDAGLTSRSQSTESLEDLNLNVNFANIQQQQQLQKQKQQQSKKQSILHLKYKSGHNNHNNELVGIAALKQTINRKPLLIDQERFLSLNPSDFDDMSSDEDDNNNNNNTNNDNENENDVDVDVVNEGVPSQSGPNSLIFIDNKLTEINNNNNNNNSNSNSINNNNKDKSNHTRSTTRKLFSLDGLTTKITKKTNNNNTNGFKLENLKNFKNKLINNYDDDRGIATTETYNNNSNNSSNLHHNHNGNNSKVNGLSLEMCENLNEQLELLQRQVTDLADTQNNIAEDRSTRTKTEYAVLQARYHMLEEQYRESELRAEERLAEEQKRHRELLARVEREASLQNENCQIKIKTIEIEANALREENQRLRILCDKQANDLHRTEEKLETLQDHISVLQQDLDEAKQLERKYELEKKSAEDLMIDLSKELERLRAEMGPALPATSPESIRLEELHQELEQMRERNKVLEEQNEELQAAVLTRGVEEGRHLLNGTLNSLAQELEEMSQAQDSVDSATLASLSQLQQAFQEKEEENTRLRHYIDTILLSIVENYPQLLEVKAIQKK